MMPADVIYMAALGLLSVVVLLLFAWAWWHAGRPRRLMRTRLPRGDTRVVRLDPNAHATDEDRRMAEDDRC